MSARIEQKLLVERHHYTGFLIWLKRHGARVLHPDRCVFSTYFDTSDLLMFRQTDEGLVPRSKVRLRCYGGHGDGCQAEHFLEIKKTSEHHRMKETRLVRDWQIMCLDGHIERDYGICLPVVSVEYRRSYFDFDGVRVTIDRNIRYQALRPSASGPHTAWDPSFAFEVKASANESLDRLENLLPFPRTHFSKYERAVRAVYARSV